MTGSSILKFQWDFPMGVGGFAAAVVFSVIIVIVSYRYAIRSGKGWSRNLLCCVRFFILATLLFCLGNPRFEQNSELRSISKNKVAVVFDTSSSMRKKGFLDKSRLEEALTIWENIRKSSGRNVRFDYFGSDEKFFPAENLGKISEAPDKEKILNTRLYSNIGEWNTKLAPENYDAVICLTDGIDTSSETINIASQALYDSGLKHFFIPIKTELEMRSYAGFKKIESPTKALTDTKMPVNILVDYANLSVKKELSLSVTSAGGERCIFSGKLSQRGSSGTGIFNVEIPVQKKGIEFFRAELKLDGKYLEAADWSVEGIEKENKKVLLYLGTFDWSMRFLKDLFSKSKRAELSVNYHPGILRIPLAGIDIGFPPEGKLSSYNVIIMANLKKSQMSPAMETALKNYLSSGGGLLFITGNPLLSSEFADSPLESLLPVEFAPDPEHQKRYDNDTMNFLKYAKKYKRAALRLEAGFKRNKESAFRAEPLRKFIITDEGKETPIFIKEEGNLIVPLFRDNASVKDAKGGAEVFALAENENGTNQIIMAVQRFGKGRSALLATDTLWRWRLGTASDCNDFEIFWENLVAWLGGGSDSAASWILPTSYAVAGKEFKVSFKMPKYQAAGKAPLNFSVTLNDKKTELDMRPSGEQGILECRFVPEKPGMYKISAGNIASAYFTVAEKATGNKELEMLQPDVDSLKKLEEAPNVSVSAVDSDIDLNSLLISKEDIISEKKVFPLWRTTWIFLLIMLFYSLDLITRRIIKMV